MSASTPVCFAETKLRARIRVRLAKSCIRDLVTRECLTNRGDPTVREVFGFLIRLAVACTLSFPAMAQLYGVAGSGATALSKINVVTGQAVLVAPSARVSPEGLAGDPLIGGLYLLDSSKICRFNLADHTCTDVTSVISTMAGGLASDNSGHVYSCKQVAQFRCTLFQINPFIMGSQPRDIGDVPYRVTGLTLNPSDGMLYGTGRDNGNQNRMFKIATSPGSQFTAIGLTPIANSQNQATLVGLEFFQNALYGSDGSNLLLINAENAEVVSIGPFGGGAGSIQGLGSLAPRVDVWIKDCAADNGITPSEQNCPEWVISPDIWVDNNDDGIIDAPVEGIDNHVYAFVRNRGSAATTERVTAHFYYRDGATALLFPADDAVSIGSIDVPPGLGPGMAVPVMVPWRVPPPPAPNSHWCIGVVLDYPDDPHSRPPRLPPEDNNVGIANLWFIASRAGQRTGVRFIAGTGGATGFGLQPWPRDFILRMEDQLPPGWSWTLEGGMGANQPFTLKLGQERPVQVTIATPPDAGPHSGGSLHVHQVDVATGRVVGGATFDVYEDHYPPVAVSSLRLAVVGTRAVLTFDPVVKESKTGLRDRVAYYEILRDGKAVARIVRDEDPVQPGMQWTDLEALHYGTTYAVRAVDEAGNLGDITSAATVTLPTRLFNWLTGTLVILVVVLFILLLRATYRN